MITDMNEGMMNLAEMFIDGVWSLFYDVFLMGLLFGLRDIIVNAMTTSVFGLSIVSVLFLMILIIGMLIAFRQWGAGS